MSIIFTIVSSIYLISLLAAGSGLSRREERRQRRNAVRQQRYQKNPEPKKKKQRDEYKVNPEPKKTRQRYEYRVNPDHTNKRQKDEYKANPEPRKTRKQDKYRVNPEHTNKRQKDEYKANPEPRKMREQKKYRANPERKKTREQKKYKANPEPKKRKMNLFWEMKKEDINPNRRKDDSNVKRADFSTTIVEMPLDTTNYEFLKSPETAVMNWHMNSSDGWRYEWDLEGYLKNKDSSEEGERVYAQSCLESLLHTLSLQKITPEKQKKLGSDFYEATGIGCEWGTQVNYNDTDYGDSQDAHLCACACCGFRDYDIDNAFRTYKTVSLSCLDRLKLNEKEVSDYKKKLKINVLLPINEEGKACVFHPWKCKSIYMQPQTGKNKDICWYFLHPELVGLQSSSSSSSSLY